MPRPGWTAGAPRPVRRLDDVTRRRLERTLLELRGRGLSFEAIAVVFDLYEGVELSTYQLRCWGWTLGIAKNAAKARAVA